MSTTHDHSIHDIPDNTTLPMLNPWQKQSNFERQKFPQDNKLDSRLNLESDAAKIRSNISQFENINTPSKPSHIERSQKMLMFKMNKCSKMTGCFRIQMVTLTGKR